jgi:hypothetical protein
MQHDASLQTAARTASDFEPPVTKVLNRKTHRRTKWQQLMKR